MNAIRFLVLLIYITGMCLILSLATVAGVPDPEEVTCKTGIICCLVCKLAIRETDLLFVSADSNTVYVGMKILMYLFLVERAHAIRAPRARRLHDWVWMSGILVIAIGFGAVGE